MVAMVVRFGLIYGLLGHGACGQSAALAAHHWTPLFFFHLFCAARFWAPGNEAEFSFLHLGEFACRSGSGPDLLLPLLGVWHLKVFRHELVLHLVPEFTHVDVTLHRFLLEVVLIEERFVSFCLRLR